VKLDRSCISDQSEISNRTGTVSESRTVQSKVSKFRILDAGSVRFQNYMRSCLWHFWVCALAVLLCSHVYAAGDFESAKRSYAARDYATAIQEFTEVAKQGNADAQLIVGKMYMIGQGAPANADEAMK